MENQKFNPENSENQQLEPFDVSQKNENGGGLKARLSPLAAAFLGLALIFVLYEVLGSILSLAIFGMDLRKADVNALRLMTSASQILFILLPALILTRFVYPDVTHILRARGARISEIFLFSVGLLILNPLLQSYLFVQNALIVRLAEVSPYIARFKSTMDGIDKMVEESYNMLLKSHSAGEGLLIIVIVAVVPALCEEVFFRGYLLKSFERKYKPFTAALVTALFFGLYHFHPYQIVPLCALGLYFGYAAYTTDSLSVPIMLHFLNNLFAVILFMIYGSDDITAPAVVKSGELMMALIFMTSLLILFSLFIIYIRRAFYKN